MAVATSTDDERRSAEESTSSKVNLRTQQLAVAERAEDDFGRGKFLDNLSAPVEYFLSSTSSHLSIR